MQEKEEEKCFSPPALLMIGESRLSPECTEELESQVLI